MIKTLKYRIVDDIIAFVKEINQFIKRNGEIRYATREENEKNEMDFSGIAYDDDFVRLWKRRAAG